jgi:hypothetical protein
VPKEWHVNELLSIQASTCKVAKIEVPIKRAFEFETLNTVTSEVYKSKEPEFVEMKAIKEYIEEAIRLIRYFRFGD